MNYLTICLIALAALVFAAAELGELAVPAARPDRDGWNMPGKTPHLVAHYLPWYQIEPGPGAANRTWEMWKYDGKGPHHNPENRLPNGLRDIASVCYPLIGPYRSWSRAVVRYHLATMKAAGIQGIIVDWYGPGSYTDQRMPLLLDQAERVGMRVAICYEEKNNWWRNPRTRTQALQSGFSDLEYIVTKYGARLGYMRRGDKPLILNFNGWGEGPLGHLYFTPDEWRGIFEKLPRQISFCHQGLLPDYHPLMPGGFVWWVPNYDEISHFGDRARKMIDERRLEYFVSMICPGFDDTGVWGWGAGPRVTPREGLSILKGTMDYCFNGKPDLVQIVTWNDFDEGTVVEPTRQYGFQDLDAIATWWAERTHRKAHLDAIRKPFLEYVRTCSPEERAELPSAPYTEWLEKRPLTVSDPDILKKPPASWSH